MRKCQVKTGEIDNARIKYSPSVAPNDIDVSVVENLVSEGYIPFVAVERVIPWPTMPSRHENDAEHSWSLAFVGLALAGKLGLDPGKVSQYAICHDLVERYAGDTSAWDEVGLITKLEREADGLSQIEHNFSFTPHLATIIHAYEAQIDEESRFVYALDKLLALVMVYLGGGEFWQREGIDYQQYLKKNRQIRKKVRAHPAVLAWYDQLSIRIDSKKHSLFTELMSE